uniref:RelA/SpoT domain-containing protein n=1 Tax=Panagrolaimus superbus TaxID=310955 RepID=A0A914YW84_9BILA
MSDSTLNESQKRYSEAKVEIQVASVLMHAWSEVEHDLVYKPLQGALSEEEYAILDELNGLVLSGEIALERLQRAGELRASTRGREFTNHYDLAASLLDLARIHLSVGDVTQAAMGRVDVLFELNEGGQSKHPGSTRNLRPGAAQRLREAAALRADH